MHRVASGSRVRFYLGFAILLSVVVTLVLISIPRQRIHIDEAWLGEQSYWQATDGVRRSELFRGLLDYENHIYVAHKLLIFLGALFVQVFGWHLGSLRLIPLISGAILVLLMWRYFRRSRDDDPRLALLVSLVYLVSAPLFFRYVNLFRPELPLAACGFASFLLMAEYIKSERLPQLLGAAALGGIGFLIHLNGIIYIVAGAVVLVWLRRWRHLFAFLALSGAVSLFYFYDIVGHWAAFWYQFHSDPALDKNDLTWYAPAWRLVNEHKRLFRKPEVIFASLLFFTSLWYYWKNLPRPNRWTALYAIALVLALGAFAQGKTVAYTILLLPVSAVIVAGATSHWLGRISTAPKILSLSAGLLWVLFLGHSLFDDSRFALTQKSDVAATNRAAAAFIPKGLTVLAPLDFVFEEVRNYNVRGDEGAAWIMKQSRPDIGDIHKAIHAPDYLGFARDHQIDAVILEDYLFSRINLTPPAVGDTVLGFMAVGKVEELSRTVFRRTQYFGSAQQ